MDKRETANVTDRISRLEKDLFSFKAAQLSGEGNTISYITETSNTWDLTVTATTNNGFAYTKQGQLIFTFTADTKPAAFTTFEVDVFIDGVPFYKSPKGPYGTFDADVQSRFQEVVNGDPAISKFQTGWMVVYGAQSNGGNTTLQVKVRAVSVDTGKLEVRQVVTL